MTSQQKKKRLRNKADRLWQDKLVKKHPKCLFDNNDTSCMHHFFTKASSSALRYEDANGINVCQGCHLKFHSKFSAEIIAKTIIIKGEGWFKNLQELKKRPFKDTIENYNNIIKQLEDEM